jgi:hypothetical protein
MRAPIFLSKKVKSSIDDWKEVEIFQKVKVFEIKFANKMRAPKFFVKKEKKFDWWLKIRVSKLRTSKMIFTRVEHENFRKCRTPIIILHHFFFKNWIENHLHLFKTQFKKSLVLKKSKFDKLTKFRVRERSMKFLRIYDGYIWMQSNSTIVSEGSLKKI